MQELQQSLSAPKPELSGLIAAAEKFYEASKAPATIEAFNADLRSFRAFTTQNHLPYLPSNAETVVLYVSSLAAADPPMTYSTIRRRLSAISFAHRRRGLESPAVPRNHFVLREVLAGIRRTLGTAQHGADPILTGRIRRIVAACPDTMLGLRDRALVLFGFAAGSRASELASILKVRDISLTADGHQNLYIRLRTSKADQDQAGRDFVVFRGEHPSTCPVAAIQAWVLGAGIRQNGGPLFRAVNRHGKVSPNALSRRSVSKILKAAAVRAGLDPESISPHGLRAGMCTSAALAGATEMEIASLSGHRSVATVRRYVRAAEVLRRNASSRLGL
jgi:site-specific recombinase XerD